MSKSTDSIQVAAFKIVKALSQFNHLPPHLQQLAEQDIMQRVQRMRAGDRAVIEGTHLIKEHVEPEPPAPVPEPESTSGSEEEPPSP